MTQEEFCKLTGIAHISGEDFAAIHTLYIATGEMNKKAFCAGIKATLTEGTSEAYGTFSCTPMWIDMTAKGINRLDVENRRLRTMVKDLEEAAREREATKKREALMADPERTVKRLEATIKDLEEAAKKREKEILAASRDLRWIAGKRGLKELADIAVDLIGAEQSARYAVEKGLVLIKEEEQAVQKAMRELTELRELRDKVTREGERPDAAAAAEADS